MSWSNLRLTFRFTTPNFQPALGWFVGGGGRRIVAQLVEVLA